MAYCIYQQSRGRPRREDWPAQWEEGGNKKSRGQDIQCSLVSGKHGATGRARAERGTWRYGWDVGVWRGAVSIFTGLCTFVAPIVPGSCGLGSHTCMGAAEVCMQLPTHAHHAALASPQELRHARTVVAMMIANLSVYHAAPSPLGGHYGSLQLGSWGPLL